MKIIVTALVMLICSCTFAQISLSNAGVGFNFNIGQRVPNNTMKKFFPDDNLSFKGSYNTSISRVFSEYRVGFDVEKRKTVYLEASLLQGTDYFDSYYSNYGVLLDTFSNSNTSLDVNSSLLGLRLLVRFSTPVERRAFVSASLGAEYLGAYDIESTGETNSYTSSFRDRIAAPIRSDAISNYGSINLVQEVGVSVKLGKKDKNYPLDQIYVQTHFQTLSNFTLIDQSVQRYRTFGLTVAMAYQF